MAGIAYPEYPPDLHSAGRTYTLNSIKDWSIAHGLAIRPPLSFVSENSDPEGVLATTAPLTIFPSLFPRFCFDQGLQIQEAYNKLYASITRDVGWLRSIITE